MEADEHLFISCGNLLMVAEVQWSLSSMCITVQARKCWCLLQVEWRLFIS